MDLTPLIILSFLLLIISNDLPLMSSAGCAISRCDGSGNPDIRFPFRIQDSNQPESSCGYPGFEVSCDGSKHTIIDLPSSGNFSVKSIDYAAQEFWVNDPNNCLPKRLLTLNLSGSPFNGVYSQDFSFLNCSKNLVSQNAPVEEGLNLIGPIPCLSGSHYFVFALPTNSSVTGSGNLTSKLLSSSSCSSLAGTVKVPSQWPVSLQNQTRMSSLDEDLRLSWFMPECQSCELNGQMCGLNTTNSSGSQPIACWNIPSSAVSKKLPLSTFIAVVLVICLPSIVCLVGSLVIWIRAYCRPSQDRQLEQASVETPRPGFLVELGLEEAGLEFARQVVRLGLRGDSGPESQPKIIESEIEEMSASPTPSRSPVEKNVCSICMSEYRPKDKIGTLPMCGHYFHVNCINEWLLSHCLIDKTCPICRAHVGS